MVEIFRIVMDLHYQIPLMLSLANFVRAVFFLQIVTLPLLILISFPVTFVSCSVKVINVLVRLLFGVDEGI